MNKIQRRHQRRTLKRAQGLCGVCNRPSKSFRCDTCRLRLKHSAPKRTPWFVDRLGPNHRVLPFVMGLADMQFDFDSD
jgi:predicted amidophosphoribosyltransferase